MAYKKKGSKEPKEPLRPIQEEDSDVDESEDEEVEKEAAWPTKNDIELIKCIRKAFPKEDRIKYDSRVNNLNRESIKSPPRICTYFSSPSSSYKILITLHFTNNVLKIDFYF
jgi:hypothetical protein